MSSMSSQAVAWQELQKKDDSSVSMPSGNWLTTDWLLQLVLIM
jgi:hypothetical protein